MAENFSTCGEKHLCIDSRNLTQRRTNTEKTTVYIIELMIVKIKTIS